MFILYTTEDMLYRICENASSDCVLDLWYKIILFTKQVAVRKEQIDTTNPWIQVLHRMDVKIYAEEEWLEEVSANNQLVLEEPTASFLLDLPSDISLNLQNNYGIACYTTGATPDMPFFANRGWHIDTADSEKEKSWEALLGDLAIPSNSIVIVDRYLFSSNSGETIEDSFTNLIQILNRLLPQSMASGVLDVSIVFDFDTINFKKDKKPDGTEIDMPYLAKRINKLKKEINRPYAYNISLLSINASCLNYDKTHNRKIFSNYYIIRAEHKLKAYNEKKRTLCDQELTFSYIFSDGLNDRSSVPEKSKGQTIKALKELIDSEAKAIKPSMMIYRNGQNIPISEYSNVLLK